MQWTLYPVGDYQNFAEKWDTLNRDYGGSPLLCSDFVTPLLECFSSGGETLAIYGDSAQPSAMAIVSQLKLGAWATFQPSQAPIGLWLQQSGESVEDLSAKLRKALPGLVLVFSVTQQDPDLLPRPVTSKNLSTLDYIETARITVQGTFDEYWSERGKNLRQNLRRQRSRLSREETRVELKIINDSQQIFDCVKAYGELESSGWKAETNTAIHIDNAQGRFYQGLLERFCDKGSGMVFQYLYNDALVATDLCIKNDEQIIILKTTYDESIKTTSPAMLMREDAFRAIFDQELASKIEFYGKLMDWHTKWSNESRVMYHTNLSSTAYLALERASRLTRRSAK